MPQTLHPAHLRMPHARHYATSLLLLVSSSMDRSVLAWNLRKTAPQPREKVRESYTHVQVWVSRISVQ